MRRFLLFLLTLSLSPASLLQAAVDTATVPLKPSGAIANRSPVFRWSTTRTPDFLTLELTRDGEKLPLLSFPAAPQPTFAYPGNLAAGSYSWRIKAGPEASTLPWSSRLAFTLPPLPPLPLLPEGRISATPTTPTFSWTNSDPEATRFVLQLFKNADLYGSLTVNGETNEWSVDWTNTLPKGLYSWRVKAVRPRPLPALSSAWTRPLAFQIGFPGETAITNPPAGTAFPFGTTAFRLGWLPADGATNYELKVLINDTLMNKLMAPQIVGQLTGSFPPAYYTLIVRGINGSGYGPWSDPVTFSLRRNMAPDGLVTNRTPKTFRWSRNENANQYRIKLAQFNRNTRKYVDQLELWIAQPTAPESPRWQPPFHIPDGKYRWTVTDFNGPKAGYSQSASFQIKNSGRTSWNDPVLLVGTWKVTSSWRWSELTFYPNGVLRTTQPNGVSFTRARWSANDTTLTLVSDVTEYCPYRLITPNRLTFTMPSGNVQTMTRVVE